MSKEIQNQTLETAFGIALSLSIDHTYKWGDWSIRNSGSVQYVLQADGNAFQKVGDVVTPIEWRF